MHLCAAEFSIISLFPGRGFDQGGTAKCRHAIFLNPNDVVGHAGHVGATGSRTPVQDYHGGYSRCRKSRKITKDIAKTRPQLDFVLQKISACTFDQVDDGKFLPHAHL